jgi:ribose 5-phosphate isomerase A
MDTALKLKGRGAKVMDASALDSLDIYIDGADAVDWEGNAIKGGGAALFREKVLASMSKFFTIIIDEEKLVKDLRERPLPVEVDPFALSFVVRKIEELGMSAFIRQAKEGKQGPVFSDSCRVIVDVDIRNWGEDLENLDAELKRIPGILETGLFIGMADVILIGGEGGIARRPGGRRVRKGS